MVFRPVLTISGAVGQQFDLYRTAFFHVCKKSCSLRLYIPAFPSGNLRFYQVSFMHPLVEQVRIDLQNAADPEKAVIMQAYMKTDQPFYGIQAGPRKKMFRNAARRFRMLERHEYEEIVLDLWQGTYREEMYQGLEAAEYFKKYRDETSWPLYEQLVMTSTWWDTLDWIAGRLISPLVRKHRRFEANLVQWTRSDHLWARRASLLAHLHHKQETNTHLLASTILSLSHEQEFFIRKAIGWILRDYAYTDSEWVKTFVEVHAESLSPLSRREAMKHISRESESG